MSEERWQRWLQEMGIEMSNKAFPLNVVTIKALISLSSLGSNTNLYSLFRQPVLLPDKAFEKPIPGN